MSQQINLYNSALRLPREWLSSANVAMAVGATLVLVLHGVLGTRYQLAQATAEAAEASQQLESLRGQLAAVNSQIAAHKANDEMAQQLDNTRSQLNSREETLQALSKVSIEPGKGFASYLRGFARQSVSGVWLTGVNIGPGTELSIHGRSLNQSLIAEYVNRLSKEPAFSGHAFAQVDMGQVVDKKDKADKVGAAIAASGTSTPSPVNAAEIHPIEFNLITSPNDASSANAATRTATSAEPTMPAVASGAKS